MQRLLTTMLLLASFLVAGCAGADQSGVSNMTDNFAYGGQVAGKSGTSTYTWHETGSSVMVSWGGQASSGSFDLALKDGAGNQVYTRSFSGTAQNGASETMNNVKSGDWTVTVTFHGFTGQMGLSLLGSGGRGTNYCPPGVPGC